MTFLPTSRAVLSTVLLLITCTKFATAQRRCPGGFFLNNGRCDPCAPGFYRPAKIAVVVSSARCFACPPGTFNPVSAASTDGVCRQCPPNTFSGRGSTGCTPCPEGLTSNHGASVYLACGPGTRFSKRDSNFLFARRNPSKCVACQRGTFSTGRANLDCEPCPEGLDSPKNSTSKEMCRPCSPGRQGPRCSKCSEGQFKAGRSGSCIQCPPGTTSRKGATSCTPCPKGTRAARFNEKCIDCRPGRTTAAKGAPLCVAEREPCPITFFKDPSGNCQFCSRGSFLDTSERICKLCPPGSISFGGLQTECQVCPPATRPDGDRISCICKDGMFLNRNGRCKKCPPGTFSRSDFVTVRGSGRNVEFRVECVKCDRGTFQDEEGATECKPCPLDKISTEEGASKCVPCPEGLVPSIGSGYDDPENIACVVPTNACPPGWVRQEVGATDGPVFGCRRVACPVGTSAEDIGKTCLPCEPGFALNEKGTRCRGCPRDEFSKGGIVTKCEKCPAGLFRDPIDPSKCSCRREGFGLQDGICKRCRRGTFKSDGSETCKLCPPGRFQSSSGQTFCDFCKRGMFAPNAGSRTCMTCPAGTFSSRVSASTKCVPALSINTTRQE